MKIKPGSTTTLMVLAEAPPLREGDAAAVRIRDSHVLPELVVRGEKVPGEKGVRDLFRGDLGSAGCFPMRFAPPHSIPIPSTHTASFVCAKKRYLTPSPQLSTPSGLGNLGGTLSVGGGHKPRALAHGYSLSTPAGLGSFSGLGHGPALALPGWPVGRGHRAGWPRHQFI
jgi:hypothetical protein